MQVGDKFTYSGEEMKALAEAAGYEVIEPKQEEPPKPVEQTQTSDCSDVIPQNVADYGEMLRKAGLAPIGGLPDGVSIQPCFNGGSKPFVYIKDGKTLTSQQVWELANSQSVYQAEDPAAPEATALSEGSTSTYDNSSSLNTQLNVMGNELLQVNDCCGENLDESLQVAQQYESTLNNILTDEQKSEAEALYNQFLDYEITSGSDGALGTVYHKGGFIISSPEEANKLNPIASTVSKFIVAGKDRYETLLNGRDYNTVIEEVSKKKLSFNSDDWSFLTSYKFLLDTLTGNDD